MVVTGLSWVSAQEHGTALRQRAGTQTDLRDLHRALLSDATMDAPFKNFGRFDEDSKRICLAVALALQDCGVRNNGPVHDTGLLISNPAGATGANAAYFRDYVDGGRKLGRANLFIYTLPTSPIAEAAIHFGLSGPLLYVGRLRADPDSALNDCVDIVADGQAAAMLCILTAETETTCAMVQDTPVPSQLCVTVEEAAVMIARRRDIAGEPALDGEDATGEQRHES